MPLDTILNLIGRAIYGNAPLQNPDYIPATKANLGTPEEETNGTAPETMIPAAGSQYRQPGFWENVLAPGVASQEQTLNNQPVELERQRLLKNRLAGADMSQVQSTLPDNSPLKNIDPDTLGLMTQPDISSVNRAATNFGYAQGGGPQNDTESLLTQSKAAIPASERELAYQTKANDLGLGSLRAGQEGASLAFNKASAEAGSQILTGQTANTLAQQKVDEGLIPAAGKTAIQEAINRGNIASTVAPYAAPTARANSNTALWMAEHPEGVYNSWMRGISSPTNSNFTPGLTPPMIAGQGKIAQMANTVQGPNGQRINVKPQAENLLGDEVDPTTLAHDTPKIKSLVQQAKDLQDAGKAGTPEYNEVANKIKALHEQLNAEYEKGKPNTGMLPSLWGALNAAPDDYPEGTIYHDWPIALRNKEKAMIGGVGSAGDWLKRKLWTGE